MIVEGKGQKFGQIAKEKYDSSSLKYEITIFSSKMIEFGRKMQWIIYK